jgi:hypothetical protein
MGDDQPVSFQLPHHGGRLEHAVNILLITQQSMGTIEAIVQRSLEVKGQRTMAKGTGAIGDIPGARANGLGETGPNQGLVKGKFWFAHGRQGLLSLRISVK